MVGVAAAAVLVMQDVYSPGEMVPSSMGVPNAANVSPECAGTGGRKKLTGTKMKLIRSRAIVIGLWNLP